MFSDEVAEFIVGSEQVPGNCRSVFIPFTSFCSHRLVSSIYVDMFSPFSVIHICGYVLTNVDPFPIIFCLGSDSETDDFLGDDRHLDDTHALASLNRIVATHLCIVHVEFSSYEYLA
ncbi:hypothetical protein MKW98_017453, partial [Papaver atlanticum]